MQLSLLNGFLAIRVTIWRHFSLPNFFRFSWIKRRRQKKLYSVWKSFKRKVFAIEWSKNYLVLKSIWGTWFFNFSLNKIDYFSFSIFFGLDRWLLITESKYLEYISRPRILNNNLMTLGYYWNNFPRVVGNRDSLLPRVIGETES